MPARVQTAIGSDQRRDFRRWSEAFGKLDDTVKAEEAEAWVASALQILERHPIKQKGLGYGLRIRRETS